MRLDADAMVRLVQPSRGRSIMTIDTHLHMWDLERCDYAWLTPDLSPLRRSFTPEEIRPEMEQLGVDAAVLVQAANNQADTRLMLEAAERLPWIVGVVGWVDLTRGNAATDEALRLAESPYVVGARHLIHNEPDDDWLIRPDVIAGLRALAAAGLVFDIVSVLPRHLAHIPRVAAALPELTLVIDHLSKPPIASGDLSEWSTLLRAAAAEPNVHAKVSGLDTAVATDTWTPDDLRPAFALALELFGADRLMYGGDWPVSILGGGYQRQYAAFESLIEELSPAEQRTIRAETATRVYGLSEPIT